AGPQTADLSLTKKVDHARSRTGEAVTYTITVTNHGPATSVDPVVADVFASPVTVVSARASAGTCTRGRELTCRLRSLAAGASTAIPVAARPTTIGVLRNPASVRSPTPDPNGADDMARAVTHVGPGPSSLRITETPSVSRVLPGQAFDLTITVRSLGPQA